MKTALYTTVYPGVEPYLSAWSNSVKQQTDPMFDVWIGVDGLSTSQVHALIGKDLNATLVPGKPDDTPIQVRQRAILRIIDEYTCIVFTDSDDVLFPTRVEAAKKNLQHEDVHACSMKLMRHDGSDLHLTMPLSGKNAKVATLARTNVLGLSNTAWRTKKLKACLPVPSECVLMDWFLGTRAWIQGMKIHFDHEIHMWYRQHAENTAQLLPPFTEAKVIKATGLVMNHYRFVFNSEPQLPENVRDMLEKENLRITRFFNAIHESARTLSEYTDALNRLPVELAWWWFVAHPKLEEIWNP
ncbi:MAG: hypothetical protein C4522_20540 [Desulfobacteraceae bacterium]|nr:MAG: hypothetical protein C4522_20540 [Desulfobacteraceae bacterium]